MNKAKYISLFILSGLLTVFGMDAFLKNTKITPPILKYYDDIYGSLNRANLNYYKSVEGFYIGNTNYDGRFRENYPKRKTDKSTLRILLIGDSFVEGIDVLSRDHFAQVMEDSLKRALHTNVEILDFGKGNCVLHASAFYFMEYLQKEYDIDLVLFFTEFRDILESNDYPSTSYQWDTLKQMIIPNFSWKNTGEFKLHSILKRIPGLQFYDDIAITRLAYRAWSGVKTRGFLQLTLGKFYGSIPEQDYSYIKYEAPISTLSKKVYDTLENFTTGQMLFVVRSIPMDAYMIIDYFKANQYPFIDLNDTFNHQTIRGTSINAHFFKATQSFGGHWNHEGHKAVGQFLAHRVLRDINTYNMPNYELKR